MSVVESASTPAATPQEPQPLSERLGAIVDEYSSQAEAADPATEATTPADGTPTPATQDGDEPKPVETPATESEKLEVTPEQLADSKFWGSLSKEQWAQMERDHPVETKLVKSAQAAATRIVNAARTQPQETPATTRTDASPDDEPSPEFLEAYEMSQSFDPKIAAKGQLRMMQLAAPTVLKENGFDPNRAKADAVLASAYTQAVEQLPEIKKMDLKELDAVVDASPVLMALVDTGLAHNIALAMVEAGKQLSSSKQSAAAAAAEAERQRKIAEKKGEVRQVVQSNARPASAGIVNSNGGAPTGGKVPLRQKLGDAFDKIAPTLQ